MSQYRYTLCKIYLNLTMLISLFKFCDKDSKSFLPDFSKVQYIYYQLLYSSFSQIEIFSP